MSNEIATQAAQPIDVRKSAYSSIKGADMDTRKRVFSALQSAKPLQDNLGKKIPVVDIVRTNVEVTNEVTGEQISAIRTVLIDDKGNAYSAVSNGIDISFANIIGVLGEPHTWGEPVVFVAKREGGGTNKYLTLELG